MKNNKGITLIALVITIIVMLILVAVTITMAVNGGLFTHAGKAAGDTQNAINAEQELANLPANMSTDQLIAKYTTGQGGGATAPAMQVKHGSGDFADLTSIGDVYYGDIVSIGVEQFYVIGSKTGNTTKIASASEINGASTQIVNGHTKLILLAMYNLKKDTNGNILMEQDTTGANNTCVFSSTNYWSSETSYPLDLNDYTIPEGATSIVTIAKTYGSSLGGEGRLMAVEEVVALGGDNSEYHTYLCPNFINSQDYWLCAARDSLCVWHVSDGGGTFDAGWAYDGALDGGVRPVVEVSISDVG